MHALVHAPLWRLQKLANRADKRAPTRLAPPAGPDKLRLPQSQLCPGAETPLTHLDPVLLLQQLAGASAAAKRRGQAASAAGGDAAARGREGHRGIKLKGATALVVGVDGRRGHGAPAGTMRGAWASPSWCGSKSALLGLGAIPAPVWGIMASHMSLKDWESADELIVVKALASPPNSPSPVLHAAKTRCKFDDGAHRPKGSNFGAAKQGRRSRGWHLGEVATPCPCIQTASGAAEACSSPPASRGSRRRPAQAQSPALNSYCPPLKRKWPR